MRQAVRAEGATGTGEGVGRVLAADVESTFSGGYACASVAKLEMSEGCVEMPRCMWRKRGG